MLLLLQVSRAKKTVSNEDDSSYDNFSQYAIDEKFNRFSSTVE